MQAPVVKKYPAKLTLTSFTCFFGLIQFLIIAAFVETDIERWKIQSTEELFTILYAVILMTSLLLCDNYKFKVCSTQCCLIIPGNCSIWHSHISPNMVHSERWSSVCCCLSTYPNVFSCCYGSPNTWRSVILWRVTINLLLTIKLGKSLLLKCLLV